MKIEKYDMKETDWKIIPLLMKLDDVNFILETHLTLSITMYEEEYKRIKDKEDEYIREIKLLENQLQTNQVVQDKIACENYYEEELYEKHLGLDNFYEQQKKLLVNFFAEYFENMWVIIKKELQNLDIYIPKVQSTYEIIRNKTDFNEVRLINNCIKHQDSIVGEELNKAFPQYILGNKIELNEEILFELKDKTVIACNKLKEIITYCNDNMRH